MHSLLLTAPVKDGRISCGSPARCHRPERALDTVLGIAASGLPVFPVLAATKAPACPGGFKAAATDPVAIRELWRCYPAPLVGVPTGGVSGLDVLDLDLTKHEAAALWWQTNQRRVPATRMHVTRSGGLHLVFQHAPGLRCSVGRPVPGIDVRAEGGYVVWWPAIGLPMVQDTAPASWPEWLLAALEPPAPAPRGSVAVAIPVVDGRDEATRHYAVAGLRRAVQRVATAPQGKRNHTLNAEVYALCRFVAAGVLGAGELAEAMAVAAQVAGLPAAETARTLASALRAGAGS